VQTWGIPIRNYLDGASYGTRVDVASLERLRVSVSEHLPVHVSKDYEIHPLIDAPADIKLAYGELVASPAHVALRPADQYIARRVFVREYFESQ
jgi:hypothetical protein